MKTKTITAIVKHHGNGAHVIVPKHYIGRKAIIIIENKPKDRKQIELVAVTQDDIIVLNKLKNDPRIKSVDWKEWKRLQKEWKEFIDDGYFKDES